ncbi:hypothetical protein DSECCO2_517790 [anaerobic digester metagenome]
MPTDSTLLSPNSTLLAVDVMNAALSMVDPFFSSAFRSSITGCGLFKYSHHSKSLLKFHGHFCTKTTLVPIDSILDEIWFFIESTTVKTIMTEKMPMVIPSTVSTVRSRFTRMAEMANKKLSFMSLRNNMTQIYELLL